MECGFRWLFSDRPHFDVVDEAVSISTANPSGKGRHCLIRPLGLQFDSAVGPIADPTGQAVFFWRFAGMSNGTLRPVRARGRPSYSAAFESLLLWYEKSGHCCPPLEFLFCVFNRAAFTNNVDLNLAWIFEVALNLFTDIPRK